MAVSEPGELEEDVRATDGRVPGRRGIATRRRLLDCAAELLTKTSYRDIKVIDIAREAGTSPATFYQYFPDVEQAVLVLAEELAGDAAYLAELVRSDWRGDRGAQTARRIVESFLEYYDRHRAVFRVVDLATEEGDLRFKQLRTRALGGIPRSTPPRLRSSWLRCSPTAPRTGTASSSGAFAPRRRSTRCRGSCFGTSPVARSRSRADGSAPRAVLP